MTDWIDGLERLRVLKEQGHLSDEQYEAAKSKILGTSPASLSQVNYGSTLATPDMTPADTSETEYYATVDDDSNAQNRSQPRKRILLGLIAMLAICLIVVWKKDKLVSILPGTSVADQIAQQCLGVSVGSTVIREHDVAVWQLTSLMNSDKMKVLAPSTVSEKWEWSNDGEGLFTLTGTTTDTLSESENISKWSFREVAGKGSLTSCGPNTLAFERELVNGKDSGQQAVHQFLMATLMASSVKPLKSTTDQPNTVGSTLPNAKEAALTTSKKSSGDVVADTPTADFVELDPNWPARRARASEEMFGNSKAAADFHNSDGPARLAGVWVPKGSYCASGETMNLRRDGTYSEDISTGKWRQNGSKLIIDDGDEPISGEIKIISDKDLEIIWVGGKRITYRLCPSDSSSEPWYPV